MNRHEDYRIFPFSQSQQNIWRLEQLYPNTPMNNICTSIRVKGRIDVALVTKCINLVLEKDLSLRMRVAVVNNRPCQYHVAFREEQFPFFNFSMTDEDGFSRWEQTVAQIPMPVLDNPLYRFIRSSLIFRRRKRPTPYIKCRKSLNLATYLYFYSR